MRRLDLRCKFFDGRDSDASGDIITTGVQMDDKCQESNGTELQAIVLARHDLKERFVMAIEAIEKASAAYGDLAWMRALISAIPYVGGSIDQLLSVKGRKFVRRRLEHFIVELNARMGSLEVAQAKLPFLDSEEAYDFIVHVLEAVGRERSKEKRIRFANIAAKQFYEPVEWDDAEAVVRLLRDLTEAHIAVLSTLVKSGEGIRWGSFKMDRPIDERRRMRDSNFLCNDYPELETRLRFICAELYGRGLVDDVGHLGVNTVHLEFVAANDSSRWFVNWISEIVVQPDEE